jgi:hypothetical protein
MWQTPPESPCTRRIGKLPKHMAHLNLLTHKTSTAEYENENKNVTSFSQKH